MSWVEGVLATLATICGLLLLLLEVGFRLGRRARARHGKDASDGLGVVEGAVFGLLGLLIAFTFSSAGGRYDERRQLIAEEANAISTSYLRLDLLGHDLSAPIRPLFREYLERRIAGTGNDDDALARPGAESATEALQVRIWNAVVDALGQLDQPALAAPVLGALNEMIDITTTRRMVRIMHPPAIVFLALAVVALLSALLAGYGRGISGKRSNLHAGIFVLVIGGAMYSILELEYPRVGFVTLRQADVVLTDLRSLVR